MIEPQNLLYVISSHKNYNVPLQRLIDTMSHNIYHEDIVVYTGGNEQESFATIDRVREYSVTHNSFDMTGAIGFLEQPPPNNHYTHVFFLHDTMELTPQSDALIRNVDPDLWSVAAFGGQCNLILCRTDYLQSRRDYILSQKNCTKTQAINEEGGLWRTCPPQHRASYENSNVSLLGYENTYGANMRLREYYSGVGIFKNKGSWGQSSPGNYLLEP